MFISIRSSQGSKVGLQVESNEVTIGALKRQFSAEHGGHLSYYIFSCKGRELNDGETLVECSIADNDEITVSDAYFTVTIQGPFPLCELTTMKVSRTTTIASIKEEITNLYNYATPKEFDLLHHGVSLVNSTLMGHNIGDSAEDTLIVAERIVTQLEIPKKKKSVTTKPIFSPTLKKKTSLNTYDAMMDAILSLFSNDHNDSGSFLRCCSMPDLIGNGEEDCSSVKDVKKKFANRKISVPVRPTVQKGPAPHLMERLHE